MYSCVTLYISFFAQIAAIFMNLFGRIVLKMNNICNKITSFFA